ncbi:LCP family protein [Actinokineospora iranica]|uniref:Cell envelope-related function transcriptional attenuator common domain-containing protein n=1 Tax=Actinokineospora iranica TaxID=1271860 RepID=A0A1G6SVY7_9PSEU|nr:LCP family protein [Actinokineospora iranica]SDD20948.1 cell envelope-related function transcriptional attenuator common domain-containing protein [Actinokineospora iranica]
MTDGPTPAAADDRPENDPESRRHGRVSVWLVSGRTALALLSAAVLAAFAVVTVRIDDFQESVTTTDALAEAQKQADAPSADDGANDILVVGSDTRTDLQGRPLSARVLRELRTEATDTINTDTLIVLRIPHNGGKSHAISIPRDTYVPVPGHREEKINGAFGVTKARVAERLVAGGESDREKIERESDSAGRTALVQTVQNLTGVRIDHYAEVTLYGFYLLTEAIDGVDVCLNHATSDPDSGADFRRGPQTVRGGDAVAFVRQRKGLPGGDLGRIVRQQTFLASAMNKVLSGGVLTDPGKLDALESAVSKTVVMDPGLHFLDLVNQAQALASGQVGFVTIPVTGVGARNDRGQSVITVDSAAVRAYVGGLASANPPPAPPPPPVVTGENLMGKRLLNLGAPARVAAPCID